MTTRVCFLRWLVLGAACVLMLGCPDKDPASDVSGNYDVTFDNILELTLKIGAAVHTTTVSGPGGVATWQGAGAGGQPITLDLGDFCGREEVQCPSETMWNKVSIHQPSIEAKVPNSHVVNVVDNRLHELPAGQKAGVVAGLVNARDEFGLVLGAGARGAGQSGVGGCALLALSVAGGRFSHEGETIVEPVVEDAGMLSPEAGVPVARVTWPEGAAVDGIQDGKVKLGFLGGCAFGPILVGASLEIVTGYTAVRTGAFDPPPFVPLDPEDVDEGIVDGGGFDFGMLDVASDDL